MGISEADWTASIEKGDIIESGRGVLRVVRDVSHHRTAWGVRSYVRLAIRRQSWTNRPYTVVNSNDLRQLGYRPTGMKWPLDSDFDRAIEATFLEVPLYTMTARDVMGVA